MIVWETRKSRRIWYRLVVKNIAALWTWKNLYFPTNNKQQLQHYIASQYIAVGKKGEFLYIYIYIPRLSLKNGRKFFFRRKISSFNQIIHWSV